MKLICNRPALAHSGLALKSDESKVPERSAHLEAPFLDPHISSWDLGIPGQGPLGLFPRPGAPLPPESGCKSRLCTCLGGLRPELGHCAVVPGTQVGSLDVWEELGKERGEGAGREGCRSSWPPGLPGSGGKL